MLRSVTTCLFAFLLPTFSGTGLGPEPSGTLLADNPFRGSSIRKEKKVGRRTRFSERSIDSLAVSPDGSLLITGRGDGRVIVRALPSLEKLQTIEDHHRAGGDRCWVQEVAFRPDGAVFATAADAQDRTIRVYDAKSFESVATLTGPRFHTCGLEFSPDGRFLVAGSTDLHIWDAKTFEKVDTVSVGEGVINEISFSPDGRHLAIAPFQGDVRVYDFAARKVVLRIPQAHVEGDPKLDSNTLHLAFSPDGRRLAVGYYFSEDIHIHDVATGKEVSRITGHRNTAVTFAFSPDGERLVSGAHDHTIRFWRVSDGKLLKTRRAKADVMSVTFTPDGQRVIAGGADGRVWTWEWKFEPLEID